MSTTTIQHHHQERLACGYVRQSALAQVQHHQESTERQYHLTARAMALGWLASAIEVIDEDQGRSGSTATHRTGFQLVGRRGQSGQSGIGLDVGSLAPGTQQQRLASVARDLRITGNADCR